MRRRPLSSLAAGVALLVGAGVAAAPPASAAVTCATTFTGTVSADWFDAGNWDRGVPTSGAQACIQQGKAAVIAGSGSTTRSASPGGINADGSAPGSLSVGSGGQLSVSGQASLASLTVSGQASFPAGSSFTVSGAVTDRGLLTVDGTGTVGGFDIDGGQSIQLTGAGTLTDNGPFHWGEGTFHGSVHLTQASGSTAVIDGDGSQSGYISDSATVTLNSPTTIAPRSGVATGGEYFFGGALELGGPTTIADSTKLDDNAVGGVVRVLPGGSLRKPSGSGTATVSVTTVLGGGSASVSAGSGTLVLKNPGGQGAISVAPSAVLQLTSGGASTFSGSITGGGSIVSAARITVSSSSTVSGPTLTVTQGGLSFAGPVTIPSLTLLGGGAQFDAALSVSGAITDNQMNGATLVVNGSATSTGLDLGGFAGNQVGGSGTLTVNGPFHWGAGVFNGSVHVVQPGSTGGTPNAATIDADGSQAAAISGATLTLNGTTNVNDAPGKTTGGAFIFSGALELGGPTTIADGVVFNDNQTGPSVVRFLPGSSLTQSPNTTPAQFLTPVEVRSTLSVPLGRKLVAQRTVTVSAGTLTVTGSLQDTRPTVVGGGTLAGEGTLTGALQLASGTVHPGADTGTLSVDQYDQSGGTLAVTATGNGQVTSVTVTGTSTPTVAGSSTIQVSRPSSYTPAVGDKLRVLSDPSATPSLGTGVTVVDSGLPSYLAWTPKAVAGGLDLVLTQTGPAPTPTPTPTPTSTPSPSPSPSPTATPTPAPVPTTVCRPTARVTLTRSPALTSVRRGATTTLRVKVSLRGTACANGFKVTLLSAPINAKGKAGKFRALAVITVREAGVATFRILAVKRTNSFLWYAAVGKARSAVGKVVVR